ncbi:MAG TPA: hypothetical protein VK563_13580 [Puia sp.]|nr:hypothetical protein [Puia sp.]
MWKKIDSSVLAEGLIIGSIITENPDDPKEQYAIRSIQDGFVRAVHANGKISLKGFPTNVLISGNWWVEEQVSTPLKPTP